MLNSINTKRGMLTLVTVFMLAAVNIFVQPGSACAGRWKTKYKQDTERTKREFRGYLKKYKGWVEKQNEIDRKNPDRAKDAAGTIMEHGLGIPGAREMIEVIDKGPRYKPPWKRRK